MVDENEPVGRPARKARRLMWMVALLPLAGVVVGLAGVLLFWSSPGQPRPFLNERGEPVPGSVSEKLRVRINGVEQGMLIKGRDSTRPVLLYLHGGMPEHFLADRYPVGLEALFTVCWWDQRGSGLSYDPVAPREAVTLEQLISDTLEVTNYLRRRFGQERVYLMAHSGGSFLGMHVVARAPELFHAYLGVGQMANQLESERLAYEYMLEQFRAQGDTRMVRRLEAAPVTAEGGVPRAYLQLRDDAMHRLGVGTTHDMTSVLEGIVLASLKYPELTLGEKANLWRGKASAGVSAMWSDMLATDLAQRLPEVRVPVYLLEGVFDRTCAYSVAQAYFDRLRAPRKGFYIFTQSAHSPVFEEPEKARRILTEDVLAGTNRLADRR